MSKALVTGSRTRADLSGKRFHHDQSTSAWPIRCSILPNEIEWQTLPPFRLFLACQLARLAARSQQARALISKSSGGLRSGRIVSRSAFQRSSCRQAHSAHRKSLRLFGTRTSGTSAEPPSW